MTFITGYVTLATFMFIFFSTHGLLQWAFNKRYVALWRVSRVMLQFRHSSRVMSHCDICQELCRIVMFMKVYVSLWRYRGLYHITMLSHRLLQWVFNKRYVALWRFSKCQIVIFIKGYVTLWCLSRFTFHCDVIEGYITLQR